jgi:hypothetical protein
VLAYVFWHWKKAEIEVGDYETRQRAFHDALKRAPPLAFHGSFSVSLSRAPWAADGNDAYEDWYVLEDFAALGDLNQAAVSGGRAHPHGQAAEAAAGGTGGVYRLRAGAVLFQPACAAWFGKPPGMRYDEIFRLLDPIVEHAHGALWMRQLTLGPAREFCLHSLSPASLPPVLTPLVTPLRGVWPQKGA